MHKKRAGGVGRIWKLMTATPWSALFMVMALLSASNGLADTKTSAGTGNWATPATWDPSGVPAAGDDVIIDSSHVVTVAASVVNAPGSLWVKSGGQLKINNYAITVSGTTTIDGTLTHAHANGTKIFTGDVIINNGGLWEETAATVVSFGGNLQNDGMLTASTGVHTFTGTGKTLNGANPIIIPSVTVNGTYTNMGTLTVATALAGSGTLTQGENSILNIGGTSATFTLSAIGSGNSVSYTGTAQTVKSTPYYNLVLANSGAKTLATGVSNVINNLSMTGTVTAAVSTNLVIGGNLDIASGTKLTVGAFAITVTGTTAIAGSLLHNSATGLKSYLGDVIITSGGSWTGSVATIAYVFGGNLTNNGTMTANTNGVHTFTGVGKRLGGSSPIAISRLTIDGSYQNDGVLIVSNALAGAGTLTQGENAFLSIAGPSDTSITIATLNAADNANTVIYTGKNQTVGATTYRNLTLTGNGEKTLAGVTVNNLLSMEDTASATGTPAFGPAAGLEYNTTNACVSGPEWITPFAASGGVTITNTGTVTLSGNKVFSASAPLTIQSDATLAGGNYQLTLAGDFSNNGTFNADTGTVELNAAGPQTLPTGAYFNVIFSGSGAKSIVADSSIAACLSIAPSGDAQASVGDGLDISVGLLKLGGAIQSPGTWGSSSAPGATHQNDTFFASTTGYLTVQADATPTVWTGDGDWFENAANWSHGLPGPGAFVQIASGTVTLTNSPSRFSEFILGTQDSEASATLVCSNWTTCLNADDVIVHSNGVMTLPKAFSGAAGLSNRVHVVCESFTLDSDATINVIGKGFMGNTSKDGAGPGGGSQKPSGAGHGGMGLDAGPGVKYGSPNTPTIPGSGGGAPNGPTGGHGGGAVFIDASGSVTVNGTINANATSGGYVGGNYSGGGSGGSIYIRCDTFAGNSTGLLTAKGGSSAAYAGAGGRIAVAYNSLQQAGEPIPQVKFNTMPGAGYLANGMGSLYLTDATWVVAPFLNFEGTWFFGGITNWASGSLAPSNSIGFGEENFVLMVTNDLVLDGAISLGMPAFSQLHCSNLILTNGGSLTVYAGLVPTPKADLTSDKYGALVSVTNTIDLAPGSWIYPYSLFYPYTGNNNTNGSSVLFMSSNVFIAAGAGFDADDKGHPGGTSLNTWDNGTYTGSGRGWGAKNLGGSQWRAGSGGGGGIYGSSNAPTFPGSGGGAGYTGSGAAGGGSVRIQALGTVAVNGSITANGGPQGGQYPGAQSCGGSGGSIFITARTFKGDASGRLTAKGSNSSSSYTGGAGGRIAIAIGLSEDDVDMLLTGQEPEGLQIITQPVEFEGTLSVTNGKPEGATYPQPGTVVFETVSGSAFSLSIVGAPGSFGNPSPWGYGTYLFIEPGTIITNSVITPDDEANGVRHACLGWELRDTVGGLINSNTTTQAIFEMTTDLILAWNWTNEYQLIVRETTGGTVNSNVHNGWYTNAAVVSGIEATASPGYVFNEWLDDVPDSSRYDASLTLTMDQPRTATASFYSQAGQSRVWTGKGFWESSTNWTPSGIPGPMDTAIIQSGTSTISRSHAVDSLTVSTSTALLFADWNTVLTGNTVTVKSGGTIGLPPAFGNNQMSNRIYIVSQTLTVETNGQINATGRGYKGGGVGESGSGPGWGNKDGGGGSHGGQGGVVAAVTGGGTNGVADAPENPGSGGGVNWDKSGSAGGGAIRLIADKALTLNGSILADGPNTSSGGGSGGSIYVTCGRFLGATNAVLSASGGNSTGGFGGGGGGRIVVHYGGGKRTGFELYPVTYLGTSSVTNGTSTGSPGQPGTIKWFPSTPKSTVFLLR